MDECELTAEQWGKSEVTVPMKCVSENYLEEHGYELKENSNEKNVQTNSDEIEDEWVKVWESDFEEGTSNGFKKATVDKSIGCDDFSPTEEDVSRQVIDGDGKYGNVLELVANPQNEGGTYVNPISARHIPFEPGKWKASGYFKAEYDEIENITVNLNLVDKYKEYFNLFNWILNPFNDNYKSVMVRTQDGDEKICNLEDVDDWHYFEITADFSSEKDGRVLKEVQIDDNEYEINKLMGTTQQNWSSSFMLNLEVANMYTNCNPKNHFTGKSRWDNIKVYRKPIKHN